MHITGFGFSNWNEMPRLKIQFNKLNYLLLFNIQSVDLDSHWKMRVLKKPRKKIEKKNLIQSNFRGKFRFFNIVPVFHRLFIQNCWLNFLLKLLLLPDGYQKNNNNKST